MRTQSNCLPESGMQAREKDRKPKRLQAKRKMMKDDFLKSRDDLRWGRVSQGGIARLWLCGITRVCLHPYNI